MIRFLLLAILLLLVARAFWRLVDGIIEAAGGTTRGGRAQSPSVKLVRDPVCGTWVAPRESLSLAARGATHYFCSDRCRDQFRKSA